jgi:hypothetical protein
MHWQHWKIAGGKLKALTIAAERAIVIETVDVEIKPQAHFQRAGVLRIRQKAVRQMDYGGRVERKSGFCIRKAGIFQYMATQCQRYRAQSMLALC